MLILALKKKKRGSVDFRFTHLTKFRLDHFLNQNTHILTAFFIIFRFIIWIVGKDMCGHDDHFLCFFINDSWSQLGPDDNSVI